MKQESSLEAVSFFISFAHKVLLFLLILLHITLARNVAFGGRLCCCVSGYNLHTDTFPVDNVWLICTYSMSSANESIICTEMKLNLCWFSVCKIYHRFLHCFKFNAKLVTINCPLLVIVLWFSLQDKEFGYISIKRILIFHLPVRNRKMSITIPLLELVSWKAYLQWRKGDKNPE